MLCKQFLSLHMHTAKVKVWPATLDNHKERMHIWNLTQHAEYIAVTSLHPQGVSHRRNSHS